MAANNSLVVCIPSGLNPASIVQPKLHWELKEVLRAGSGLLLTADAWQGAGFSTARPSSGLRSLLGKVLDAIPADAEETANSLRTLCTPIRD